MIYLVLSSSFHIHYCSHISEVFAQNPVVFWEENKRGVFHVSFTEVGVEQMWGVELSSREILKRQSLQSVPRG